MTDVPEAAVAAALEQYYPKSVDLLPEARVRRMLEAAMPHLERDIRDRIAASLRRAAAGRREYAEQASASDERTREVRDRLLLAAQSHESSAKIIEDPRHILDVIPSWRWTDGEREEIRP